MAIYKSVKGVGKSGVNLKNLLDYVSQEKKEEERVYKTTGINCSNDSEKAFKQMMITKRLHDNLNGRQYKHHIQSFKPTEVSPEQAHKIAIEFVKNNFKNFDVYIATHVDKEHIHNHIIINSVARDSGLKIRELNNQEIAEKEKKNESYKSHEFSLQKLKDSSDKICLEHGLNIIEKNSKKSLNIYDKKEYKAITKNRGKDSYKTQLAFDIKKAMQVAKNKHDFIKIMGNKGVYVEWEEQKKNITFKFKDETKKSIRLSNLEKTYKEEAFIKENFIKAIEKEKEFKIKILPTVSSKNKKEESQKEKEQRYQKLVAEKEEKQRLEREQKAREEQKKKELEKEKIWERKRERGRGFER